MATTTPANKVVTVTGMEIVDASGLSTGVRGLELLLGRQRTAPTLGFDNRQDFVGYNGDLDLRGALNWTARRQQPATQALVADVIEGRGGS